MCFHNLFVFRLQDSPKTDSIDIYGEFFPKRKEVEKEVQKEVKTQNPTNTDDNKSGMHVTNDSKPHFKTICFAVNCIIYMGV